MKPDKTRKPGPKPRRLTVRQRHSLEAAAARLAKAEDRAVEVRDDLLRRMLDVYDDGNGASIREIAKAVGLSHARVGELLLRHG